MSDRQGSENEAPVAQREAMFQQADSFLFKERKYTEAETIYNKILGSEPNNIDAINSIAYCIKFRAAAENQTQSPILYQTLFDLYQRALQVDSNDIEANFNVGLLHLQFGQAGNMEDALNGFKKSVEMDMSPDAVPSRPGMEARQAMYRAQFAKAYYNIGMIYDRQNDIEHASEYYKRAQTCCEQDPDKLLTNSATYMKAATNYAVTLEKLAKRDQAVTTLNKLKNQFGEEMRVHNNLAIIQKRNGDNVNAAENFKKALISEPDSFYPNYNLGLLLSQNKTSKESLLQSLKYFNTALNQATKSNEKSHEYHVLLNMSQVYEELNDMQAAIVQLEAAYEIDKNKKIMDKIHQLRAKSIIGADEKQDSERSMSDTQTKIKEKMLASQKAQMSRQSSRQHSNRQSRGSEDQGVVFMESNTGPEEMSVADKALLDAEIVVGLDPLAKQVTEVKEVVSSQEETKLGGISRKTSGQQYTGKDKGEQIGMDTFEDPIVRMETEELEHQMLLEQEEARASHSARQKKAADATGEEEEEESEEEDKKQAKTYNFQGWMKWSKAEAIAMSTNSKPEFQKRGLYRLGVICQGEGNNEDSLKHFRAVKVLDPSFCREQVHIREAEVLYKMNMIEEAFKVIAVVEKEIKAKDKYLVHMIKGKCYDRLKDHSKACAEFEDALKLCRGKEVAGQLIGNVKFRLGWSLVRSGDDKNRGIQLLTDAQKEVPQNTDIMIKLANVLYTENKSLDESEKLCKQAIEKDPGSSECLLLLGKINYKNEKFKEAIDYLENAVKVQVEDALNDEKPKANTFFFLGMSYEKTKDYKRSMLNFKKTLTLDKNNFGASIHLANLLANLGEGQRAAKYFMHAIKIDPDSVNAHFGLGKAIQQYADDKEAPIKHFEEVLKRDPNHCKTLTQLGILHLDREDFDKSAQYLKRALLSDRKYPLALVSMGNLLFETGHAENAIKYHLQALKFNEKELQALIGLGNAYYDTGKPEDAIKYYRKALEIDDHLSDVHYNLGNALYLNENIDDAITHYKAAIGLNPKKPESFYNLGNALCVKSDYTNAVAAYKQAIELDPKNAPAFYNLGNALYMLNKFEESVSAYHKALEINQDSPECHFNLASAYNDLGQFEKAVKYYKMAIQLDDTNVDAYLCLGGAYESLSFSDKAYNAYQYALRVDPESSKAQEALARLKNE